MLARHDRRAIVRLLPAALLALAIAPAARAQDADGDGIADASDNCPLVANADQSDCDQNGVGDACQSSESRTTGNMGAFGSGVTASGTLAGIGPSLWPVRITVKAIGDLNLQTEFATLRLAGSVITSTLFQTGGSDCPATPDQATIIIPAAQWNALVAASSAGSMAVSIVGNSLVSATQCGNAFSEVIATFTVSLDCNANGVLDYCDRATGAAQDCNGNGIPDSCDIASGAAADVDADGVPDSCETDCNANGLPDDYEIAAKLVADCDGNGIPDACDIAAGAPDCNQNGVFDACEIATGAAADCDGNDVPDACDIAAGAPDCNANGIPDACDIASGAVNDIDHDGVPDSCETDCNGNGLPDDFEIAQGTVPDCNANGIPDTCDIASGLDRDCNGDGRLDQCEVFFDGAADDNQNCTPDACEYARGDFGLDGAVDGKDLGYLLSAWGSEDPFADLNGDGTVDGADLGVLLSAWGPTGFGSAGTCLGVPLWATLVEYFPNPAVVTDPALRTAIIATGRPWRVRDTATQVEMLLVPPGTFQMGCIMGSDQYGCYSREQPVHQVTLTNAYYLGRYELTQSQWVATMGSNPSFFQGSSDSASRPVEQVSWNTIQGYLSATGFRLPTEAEWEYACRAGTQTPFYNGSTDDSTVGELAWYSSNSSGQTHAVGGKLANAFGFHDMLGNVWEWVNDWAGTYPSGAQTDPTGPVSATYRVVRGGSGGDDSGSVRSTDRLGGTPGIAYGSVGFRVARTP
jgi:formylglycine-generating enzyme required for sulfatase activity